MQKPMSKFKKKSTESLEIQNRKFKITANDLLDKKIKRTIKAESRLAARMQMESEGLTVTSIKEVKKLSEIQFGKTVSQSDLLNFTRQMAAFSAAGLGVLEALALLERSSKNKEFKKILNQMGLEIRDGETLTNAARQHEDIFPRYYLSILESSERTGDLTETFEILAIYLERDLASIRAVKSALYYPILLILLAFATVFILSTTVLPKFAIFFASLDAKLPLSTRLLISMSGFVASHWFLILIFIVCLVIGFLLYKDSKKGEKVVDALLLRLPIVGKIFVTIILERFTRVLSSLLGAGVPLPDSLDLASGAVSNRVYSDALITTKEGVLRGEGFSDPLEDSNVFPEEAIQMFRVGEQSGHLTSQLDHASKYYAKEVDYKLKNLTTLIEPLVLLIVGGGVGFVAIALVSAMYGIYSSSSLNG